MTANPDRSRVIDALLAVGAAAFAVGALINENASGSALPLIGLAVVAALSLIVRRKHAVPVLAVVLIARLLVAWVGENEMALSPAAALALYTLARHSDRRPVLIGSAVAGTVVAAGVALVGDDQIITEFLGEAAQMLLAVAVGDAVRNRERRLEDRIETEAVARVQAERLRIARDLHDVVAHGLSVIAVQSGVASHLLDRDLEQAREALDAINTAGRSSLEELRSMVGVLRADEGAELLPVPTDPDDFSAAEAQAAVAGLDLRISASGQFPPTASDACVVAVHRIVQEALTNVARHAGAVSAELELDHAGDAVTLRVTNESSAELSDRTSQPDLQPGAGIIGMTERALSLGGSLEARPQPQGGFLVVAVLPYHRTSS